MPFLFSSFSLLYCPVNYFESLVKNHSKSPTSLLHLPYLQFSVPGRQLVIPTHKLLQIVSQQILQDLFTLTKVYMFHDIMRVHFVRISVFIPEPYHPISQSCHHCNAIKFSLLGQVSCLSTFLHGWFDEAQFAPDQPICNVAGLWKCVCGPRIVKEEVHGCCSSQPWLTQATRLGSRIVPIWHTNKQGDREYKEYVSLSLTYSKVWPRGRYYQLRKGPEHGWVQAIINWYHLTVKLGS